MVRKSNIFQMQIDPRFQMMTYIGVIASKLPHVRQINKKFLGSHHHNCPFPEVQKGAPAPSNMTTSACCLTTPRD
jgi:hypothetical protein